MKRLKTLPALRPRYRYVLFQVLSKYPFRFEHLERAFNSLLLSLFGELGVSKMRVKLLQNCFDEGKKLAVVRCDHRSVFSVLAILGLLYELEGHACTVRVLKISGTLKRTKEFKVRGE